MAGSPGAGEGGGPRAPPAASPGGGGSPRVPLRERSREDLLRLVGEGARRVKVLQGRLAEAERLREGAEAERSELEKAVAEAARADDARAAELRGAQDESDRQVAALRAKLGEARELEGELTAARAQLEEARAQLGEARAQLEEARTQLEEGEHREEALRAGAVGGRGAGEEAPSLPRAKEELDELEGELWGEAESLRAELEEVRGRRAKELAAAQAELEGARAEAGVQAGRLRAELEEAQGDERAARSEAQRLRESEEALSSELCRRLEASAAQERRLRELAAEKDALEAALEAGAERAEAAEAQLDASLEELDRVLAEGTPGEQLLQRLQRTVEETRGETAALRQRRGWDSPLSSPRPSTAGNPGFRRSVSLGPVPEVPSPGATGPGALPAVPRGERQTADLEKLLAEKSAQAAEIEELKAQVEGLLGAGDVRDVVREMQAVGGPAQVPQAAGGEPAPPPGASDIPPEYLKNVVVKLLETGRWAELLPAVASMLALSPDEVARLEKAYRERDAPLEAARAAVEAGQGFVSQSLGAAGAAAGALYGVFDRGVAAAAVGGPHRGAAPSPAAALSLGSLFGAGTGAGTEAGAAGGSGGGTPGPGAAA